MYMEGAGWYSSWNTSAGWWWVYLEGSIRDGILGLRCVYVYTWFDIPVGGWCVILVEWLYFYMYLVCVYLV